LFLSIHEKENWVWFGFFLLILFFLVFLGLLSYLEMIL
jgi:hypothetical protein